MTVEITYPSGTEVTPVPVFLTFRRREQYRRLLRQMRKLREGKRHMTSWGSNTIEFSFGTLEEAEYFVNAIKNHYE